MNFEISENNMMQEAEEDESNGWACITANLYEDASRDVSEV